MAESAKQVTNRVVAPGLLRSAAVARRMLPRRDSAQRGTHGGQSVTAFTLGVLAGASGLAALPGPALAATGSDFDALWPALLAIAAVVVFLGLPMGLLMRDHRRLRRRLDEYLEAGQRQLAAAQASHEVTRSQVALAERNFRQLRTSLQSLPVPLSAALSTAERLSMLSGGHPELRHEASALAESLQSIVAQLGELLESAELEHHDVHLAFQELDLAALLRGVCAHYALRAAEKRQRMDTQCDVTTPVKADLSRMREAVEQVIAFALRATPPGGRIEVELRHQARHALLSVRDQAPPFKPAQVAQLFARGSRGGTHATTTQESGLWIVRRVAELHGGEVQLAPRAEGGNELVLRIPLADAAVRPPGGAATVAT